MAAKAVVTNARQALLTYLANELELDKGIFKSELDDQMEASDVTLKVVLNLWYRLQDSTELLKHFDEADTLQEEYSRAVDQASTVLGRLS